MYSSAQLIRTNPAITSNYKLVSSKKKGLLYMEAFESNSDLGASRFKHFIVPELSFLSERVSTFFKDIPSETGFAVKNNILPETGVDSYFNQLDDIYTAKITTVEDTWYDEEFEAFAPLLINKNNLPEGYIVLRIDGPGEIDSNKDNFKSDLLNKAKIVHYSSLTKDSVLGRFLSRNYIDNPYYLQNAIEIEIDNLAFSRWNGIDYYNGGYTSKSFSTSEIFYNELTPYMMEKFLTSGFKMLNVAWTGILNLKFLFDDTPAAIINNVPQVREWSQNRYLGFYIDKTVEIEKYSPYKEVKLKYNNIYLLNNTFYEGDYSSILNKNIISIIGNSSTNIATVNIASHGLIDGQKIQIINTGIYDGEYNITYIDSNSFSIVSNYNDTVLNGQIIDPYVDPTEFGWNQLVPVYIRNGKDFLSIDKTEIYNLNNKIIGYKYSVISKDNHNGNILDAFDTISYKPIKLYYDGNVVRIKYTDDTFINLNNKYNLYNDLLFIEIDNQQYRLQYDINGWYINTDQLLYTDGINLTILNANGNNKNIPFNLDPIYFTIKSCKFCDIKDLDTTRINTKSSRFEHESYNLNYNQDPKLYMLDDNGVAIVEKDYLLQDPLDELLTIPSSSSNFYIPVSSEYSASGDLFTIQNNKLNDIWRKNALSLKWSFTGSKGRSDGGYLFNNSFKTLGYGNREPLSDTINPDRIQCNLDWFYTIGSPIEPYYDGYGTTIPSADIEDSLILPKSSFIGWKWTKEVYHSLCITPPSNLDLIISNNNNSPNYQRYFWRYNYFNLETYSDNKCPFDYFEWFFTRKTKNLNNEVIYKWSTFNDSLNDVVPCETLFRGLLLQIWNTTTKNPLYKEEYSLVTSNEYDGYKFASILTKRPTSDSNLYGKAGIDIYVNKIYKNILLAIFVYVPYDSLTNIEFIKRDDLYDVTVMNYLTGGSDVLSLNISQLTLKNIIHKINEPDYDLNGLILNKYVIENKKEYNIINITPATLTTVVNITLEKTTPFNIGDYIDINFLSSASNLNGTHKIIDINIDNTIITIAKPVGASNPGTYDNSYITESTSFVPFVITAHEADTLLVNTNSITRKDITNNALVPTNSVRKNGTDKTFITDNNIVPSIWNEQKLSNEFITKNNSRWESEIDPTILKNIRRFKGGYEPLTELVQLYKTTELYPLNIDNEVLGTGLTIYNYNDIDMLCIETPNGFYYPEPGNIVFITDTSAYGPTGSDILNTDRFYKVLDVIIDDAFTNTNYIILDKRAPIDYVSNNTFTCILSFYDLIESNTRFDTSLNDFGNINIMESRYFGKDTPIKDNNMIYPMIDEVGMTERKRYIFKSSWDKTYYNKSKNYKYNKNI